MNHAEQVGHKCYVCGITDKDAPNMQFGTAPNAPEIRNIVRTICLRTSICRCGNG